MIEVQLCTFGFQVSTTQEDCVFSSFDLSFVARKYVI